MKKILAIAGILALSITPTASFADHLEPNESEIRPGGNLAHTNLSGANLSNTNLSNANLNRADLNRADMNHADLSNANLSRADLKGADLSEANLNKAFLRGINATNLNGCPSSLPSGWVCENSSLIQR